MEEFDIKRPIEVIPNFVNCDLYCRKPNPRAARRMGPGRRADPDASVEFPSREAHYRCRGNVRPGPRENARQAGADRGWPGPRRRRISGAQEKARATTFISSASRIASTNSCRRRTCFCCLRTWNRSAWRHWKRWPARFRWWPRTSAACRKWWSTALTDICSRPREVEIGARYALEILVAAGSRTRHGAHGARQRQEKILRQ